MDIFISWSGSRSKRLAEILSEWLPAVIQAVKPYFTPDDISKGTKWSGEISKQLEASRIGLICLTPDNFAAPWILFEAGALSKNLDKSRVCPILFDLEPTDVTGPLVQFQFTQFNAADFKRLVGMINAELGEGKIADATLNTVFEMWWPKLEQRVKEELTKQAKGVDKAVKRSDRELLEELLSIVRTNVENQTENISPRAIRDLAEAYGELVDRALRLEDGFALSDVLERMQLPINHLVHRIQGRPQVAAVARARLQLERARGPGQTRAEIYRAASSGAPAEDKESTNP